MLQILTFAQFALIFPLEPRLNRFVLSKEITQVRHQIFDHVHVRQGVDFQCFIQIGINLAEIKLKRDWSGTT